MSEPTEQEINRGIAEWMGWKQGHSITGTDGCTKYYDWGWTPPAGSKAKLGIEECPSFTTSHDACHQALERMSPGQIDYYDLTLNVMCGLTPDNAEQDTILEALVKKTVAKPALKALAIYQVVKGEGR